MKKHVFFTKVIFFWKKSHRQGCTKPKTELGCTTPPISNPNPHIANQNPSKHQIIGFWRSAAEAAACKLKNRKADTAIRLVYICVVDSGK